MDDVERLNYVNGRRLDAADLRLEQDYLVAMRRRLNKGLFTPGVVTGLEVEQEDPTHVNVAAGLALDPCGREIVLTEPVTREVPAQPASASLGGYFLVISYDEQALAGENPDCAPSSSEPARIRERPRLDWTEEFPFHGRCGKPEAGPLDCAVALALVSLDDSCEISSIDISLRDIARRAPSNQVHPLSLEGEKDIDPGNPKRLHFVIRGGTATSVWLYLWADRFSSLYYTQIGRHKHTLSNWSVTPVKTDLAAHTHDLQNHNHPLPKTASHEHTHRLGMDQNWLSTRVQGLVGPHAGFRYWPGDSTSPLVETESHWHSFVDPTLGPTPNRTGDFVTATPSQTHHHTVSARVDNYPPDGSTHVDAGAAPAYAHFGDLRVELDGTDITQDIVDLMPGNFNRLLGDTTSDHPLVKVGTDGIELTRIAHSHGMTLDSTEPHELTFIVPPPPPGNAATGGKILYNLFVA